MLETEDHDILPARVSKIFEYEVLVCVCVRNSLIPLFRLRCLPNPKKNFLDSQPKKSAIFKKMSCTYK